MRNDCLRRASPAFRLAIATSWLAPGSWQDRQKQTIQEICDAGLDWEEYLKLVDRHRIPALSWAALRQVKSIVVPQAVGRELQRLSDACRMQAMQQTLLLVQVLKRFNAAAVPVMPLKGPVLSFELYGDVGLRQFKDLDLAVAEEDLERAQTCLQSAGWNLEPGFVALSPRQWESCLRNEYEMVFVHSSANSTLELQWRNKWETHDVTRSRWARNTPSEWQGCSILAMNPGDQTLYLCGHGAHHAWFRAKWLGDLARAHALGLLDWEAAFAEARRLGQERVIETGASLLNQLYGLPLPDSLVKAGVKLSPRLIEIPVEAIKDPQVPGYHTDLASLRYRLRMTRYERLLGPRSWRQSLEELFHCRDDFKTFPLPDRLFWTYRPLRPFLWLLRFLRMALSKSPQQKKVET